MLPYVNMLRGCQAPSSMTLFLETGSFCELKLVTSARLGGRWASGTDLSPLSHPLAFTESALTHNPERGTLYDRWFYGKHSQLPKVRLLCILIIFTCVFLCVFSYVIYRAMCM